MTKRIRAKYKIDRRLGQKLWGRAKSPLNKRESRPGQHGERRMSKPSDYGQQLRAKQKLKGYYGNIGERQFRRIYEEARRFKGSTSEHLIGLLERRLDAIVYRAKFVPTVFAARQFVSHGHVKVNGRRVNIASYRCKVGDLIEVGEKGKQMALLLEASVTYAGVGMLPVAAKIDYRERWEFPEDVAAYTVTVTFATIVRRAWGT